MFQQLGIGFAIGFAVRTLFAAVELAGAAVGFQMGLGFAAFFDPSINAQSSAVARFFGHMAVQKSFDAFPVSATPFLAVGTMKLHELGTDLFASAMWIALPLIGMLMFVNLALGFVLRVAPQMNIYAIGFPVTLSAGLIGLAATLPMLDRPFNAVMERVIDLVSR